MFFKLPKWRVFASKLKQRKEGREGGREGRRKESVQKLCNPLSMALMK
jgi:hypothetical protein